MNAEAIRDQKALSGPRRAAILLIALGEQTSAEIIKGLNEDEVQIVSREIAHVKSVTMDQSDMVLEEFHQLMVGREYVKTGGIEYANKMLKGAFGPETAKKIYDRLIKLLGSDVASFDVLHRADPQQLSKFIHSEHPQTIALILSHLSSPQAAILLTSLPPEMRSDVALRMASLDQISPEIIAKIAGIIGQKLSALGDYSRESYGGIHAVSEMFNRLDPQISKDILDTIQIRDAGMVETIRHLMFVFEDLLQLDEHGMKELNAKVDRKCLTLALKGTSVKLQDHFRSGMSQRAGEMLKEDIDVLGPVKIKDVTAAQEQIINLVRQLESEGILNLRGSATEQYVV